MLWLLNPGPVRKRMTAHQLVPVFCEYMRHGCGNPFRSRDRKAILAGYQVVRRVPFHTHATCRPESGNQH